MKTLTNYQGAAIAAQLEMNAAGARATNARAAAEAAAEAVESIDAAALSAAALEAANGGSAEARKRAAVDALLAVAVSDNMRKRAAEAAASVGIIGITNADTLSIIAVRAKAVATAQKNEAEAVASAFALCVNGTPFAHIIAGRRGAAAEIRKAAAASSVFGSVDTALCGALAVVAASGARCGTLERNGGAYLLAVARKEAARLKNAAERADEAYLNASRISDAARTEYEAAKKAAAEAAAASGKEIRAAAAAARNA